MQAMSVDAHIREGWQCVRTCSTIKQTALPYALTLVGGPGSGQTRGPIRPVSMRLPSAVGCLLGDRVCTQCGS